MLSGWKDVCKLKKCDLKAYCDKNGVKYIDLGRDATEILLS